MVDSIVNYKVILIGVRTNTEYQFQYVLSSFLQDTIVGKNATIIFHVAIPYTRDTPTSLPFTYNSACVISFTAVNKFIINCGYNTENWVLRAYSFIGLKHI